MRRFSEILEKIIEESDKLDKQLNNIAEKVDMEPKKVLEFAKNISGVTGYSISYVLAITSNGLQEGLTLKDIRNILLKPIIY